MVLQQLLLSPHEQQLLAAQNVPITAVGLAPALTQRLLQAYLLTPHQVLDLSCIDLAQQLEIDAAIAMGLFATLDAYFSQVDYFPWLYPMLPPTCFQKPLDVLGISSLQHSTLANQGYERLGQLAVLPAHASAEIHAALAAYVHSFRCTRVQYQQRTIHIHGLRGLSPSPYPDYPLVRLPLSAGLLHYLQHLGVTSVNGGLSPTELKLLFALTPAWAEELYGAMQRAQTRAVSLPPVNRSQPLPEDTDPILVYFNERMLFGILAQAGYQGLSLQQIPAVVAALQQLWECPLATLRYFQQYLPEWLHRTQLSTLGQLVLALHHFYCELSASAALSVEPQGLALVPVLEQAVVTPSTALAAPSVPAVRGNLFRWLRRLGSST